MEYGSNLPEISGKISEDDQLFMENLGITSPMESMKRRRVDDVEDTAASKSKRV